MGDRFSSRNKKDKKELEQPLLGPSEGRQENRPGMWWLSWHETSESKIDHLKLELLKSTKSAFKSFKEISNKLYQVKNFDESPYIENLPQKLEEKLANINKCSKLSETNCYDMNLVKNYLRSDIRENIENLSNEISEFNKYIRNIGMVKDNIFALIAKDNNMTGKYADMVGKINKLVTQLPNPVVKPDLLLKDISEQLDHVYRQDSNLYFKIEDEEHFQLIKAYISYRDVFTN